MDTAEEKAHYHTKTYLFPVISLIGHNQEPTIINEIAEEVLQTTWQSLQQGSHTQQQNLLTFYHITEQKQNKENLNIQADMML